MSVTLLAALLAQAVSVTLLRHRLGPHWLRHPVTLVTLAGVVYQGVAPLLLTIPAIGAWNIDRIGIQPGWADNAALLTSAGMLAFTVGFLVTHPERALREAPPRAIRDAARLLNWKWLLAASLPLAAWTYSGRGYNNGEVIAGSTTALSTDLAATFFVLVVALTTTSVLLRFGGRWFLPALLVQSLVLAAAGERTPILTDAVVVVLMLALAGARPRPRELCAAAAIGLVAVLAITSLRAQQGRSVFHTDTGVSARLAALGNGVENFAGTSAPNAAFASPGLVAQAAVRLDGVDWTAAILQSVHDGQPRLPAVYAAQSLLVVVPSSVWSSKLAKGTLNPALLEQDDFGIQPVNLLPTMSGLYAGYFSPPWLLAILAALGLLCGHAERWLFRRCTPARFVLIAGAVTAALRFEAGLPEMLIGLRAAAVIAATIKVVELVRRPVPVVPQEHPREALRMPAGSNSRTTLVTARAVTRDDPVVSGTPA